MRSLRTITITATVVAAMLALPISLANVPAANAEKVELSDTSVTVKVDNINIKILKVNDYEVKGQDITNLAFRTLSTKNKITFTTDSDTKVEIKLKDKVLWSGEVKANQPTTADVDLAGVAVGTHSLSIRAAIGDTGNYSNQYVNLDYRAVVPSIVPGGDVLAPKTGLYVNLAGQSYSMTTIAIFVLLSAVVVYMVSAKKTEATATVSNKSGVKSSKKSAKAKK